MAGKLERASPSISSRRRSTVRPESSSSSCSVRAAYLRTCTASSPEMSLKNQPQLVWASRAWRCISSSLKVRTCWPRRTAGAAVAVEETARGSPASRVEQQLDVGVARLPGVLEQIAAELVEERGRLVAHQLDGAPQRRAPGLVPALGRAGVAAAVAAPAPHPVRAAPGRALAVGPGLELDLPGRRVAFEVLAVVGEAKPARRDLGQEGVGERALGVPDVVAEGLAVDGGVNELRTAAPLVHRAPELVAELPAGVEHLLEADRVRDRPVVEEDVDEAASIAGGEAAIGLARVDLRARHRGPVLLAEPAHAGGLLGGQDHVAQPLGDEVLDRGRVDGRLGQPERLGRAAEAVLEVALAPANLGQAVAVVAERQDGVAESLRDGVAVAAAGRGAEPVSLEEASVGVGLMPLQPGEQRGPEVEREMEVVVDQRLDPALVVKDARPAVRAGSTRRRCGQFQLGCG